MQHRLVQTFKFRRKKSTQLATNIISYSLFAFLPHTLMFMVTTNGKGMGDHF